MEGYTEIYHKGGEDKFNGTVFVKFNSVAVHDRAMERLNSMRLGLDEKLSFMSPDPPMAERVPRTYLFGSEAFAGGVAVPERQCVRGYKLADAERGGEGDCQR